MFCNQDVGNQVDIQISRISGREMKGPPRLHPQGRAKNHWWSNLTQDPGPGTSSPNRARTPTGPREGAQITGRPDKSKQNLDMRSEGQCWTGTRADAKLTATDPSVLVLTAAGHAELFIVKHQLHGKRKKKIKDPNAD